ncbi:hypothetical protein FVEG_13066 [Fusarium verticillioides 7600]|uniref:Zn(2)-C6 fungal-type domain-containing protein n=1 Tax=Gibberella moniliformis (strain M3125 / FGSC 7600) TaxID=334819 RepID=W7N5R5_GIBM7|nr:hypothetical protein FVEG_13066 [Fusarium verticillioides 7600]EWG54994.1 hypothetical protein FVEG_13066 [Fusarium verticillioides 7600]
MHVTGARSRRACDRCAHLKAKCDSGRPCHRCISQGVSCAYNGNLDQHNGTLQQPALNSPGASDGGRGISSPPRTIAIPQASPQRSVETSDLLPVMTAQGSREESGWLNGDSHNLPWGLDVPSLPLFPPFVLDGAPDVMLELEQLDPKGLELSSGRLSEPALSFLSLEQPDPLQAKCGAIQTLLQGPGPELPENVVTRSINRENLLQALQLFSRNFQHHIPILHAPTFNLATASPLLVLAMFTHEIDMSEPSLSSIQASIAASSVLGSSQDETSLMAFPLYFARSISMAKRAAVFDTSPLIDYITLTEKTFDWHLWVERETRIRIANVLFSQDVSSCIFMGTAPTFSPLDLDIELP